MSSDLSRRRMLLAAAAAGVTGLAGCTGDGPGSGGEAIGTPTPTATRTSTAAPTDSPTPTATESPTPTGTEAAADTPAGASEFCAPVAGSPTPFDVSGMPFVFAFDYVDSWSVGEPIEQSSARYERIESPTLTSGDGESSATIRVGQSFEARTKAEVEEYIQETLDAYEGSTIAYEEEFNGETVPFVETSNAGLNSYGTYLPYGEGDRRYYTCSVVAYNEVAGGDRTIADCSDLVRAATETVRGSLTVNTETTIDQR